MKFKSIQQKHVFLIIAIILAMVFVVSVIFSYRAPIKQNIELQTRKILLPTAQTTSTVEKAAEKAVKEKKIIPEVNLAVPFVSQAPLGNWDEVHNETCEEASILMIEGFIQGRTDYPRQEMEDNLQKIISWEVETFGFSEDTTVEETVKTMQEYLGLSTTKAYYDISIEDIKNQIRKGRPVIVPAAGKILPNPYFKNGGPIYHMLVVKGFTKDGLFITNDPGTNRLGEDLTYSFSDLYNAIHDWVKDGDILTGKKAMIVVE